MAANRNQSVEIVRIAAAFGIVVFHSKAPGGEFGYAGLIAFTMLATYFGGSGNLVKRLLIPWGAWSVFYVGWRIAATGNPFFDGLGPLASIFYGGHLWFLPFIFVILAVFRQFRSDKLSVPCAVLGLMFCLAASWWKGAITDLDPPLAQWLQAFPAALFGIAIGSSAGRWITGAALGVAAFWNIPGITIPYLLGAFAVLFALKLPMTRWNVEGISSCMIGVYLVHIAALGVVNRVLEPQTFVTVVVAFFASLAGVWLARRYIPLTRWILG